MDVKRKIALVWPGALGLAGAGVSTAMAQPVKGQQDRVRRAVKGRSIVRDRFEARWRRLERRGSEVPVSQSSGRSGFPSAGVDV